MAIIISAIIIFLLLCASAVLAFIAPLEPQNPKHQEAETISETDGVLVILAQHSKNVPAIVGVE
jgi:hypothetical protein